MIWVNIHLINMTLTQIGESHKLNTYLSSLHRGNVAIVAINYYPSPY